MDIQQFSLDGEWLFQHDPQGNRTSPAETAWRSAMVPAPWQAQFEDLRLSAGVAWYRRTFDLGAPSSGDPSHHAAILHFGAVDYHATLWINGQRVGEHEGGYSPFEFDVTPHLKPGPNELMVRVVDPTDNRAHYPDFPFSEIPHGKQSWYGPLSGIWQSVWLEIRPRLHIRDMHISSDPQQGSVAIDAQVSGSLPENALLQAVVRAPDGSEVAEVTLDRQGLGVAHLASSPLLWDLESPHLYSVEVALLVDGMQSHAVSKSCGFRTLEARDGRIFLNGRAVYLRSVLDQGYFPETIYTPPSLEYLEDQAQKLKALGFNSLRIHIKMEDPRYYDVADRLGLLVWTEIPNWALLTEASARRGRQMLRDMIHRDGHHPSIIAWTLINENWGTDLPRNAEHRRWLADFYAEAKALDPTRLIVENSACNGNAHVRGDLDDFHQYRAIPDHAREWDAWVADFAGRADWAWSSDYSQFRSAGLPLVLSEFGNWGLPDPAEIQERGSEPWWMETGHDWGDGIVYPHGVQYRFEACGLGDVFPDYAIFARESQEHMARSLHYEISTQRLHDSIAGYVVTEATDVHWECNGVLTMQRKVKHGLDRWLTPLNQDRVVVLRPHTWSGNPGDKVAVTVAAKGIGGADSQGVIRWASGSQKGEVLAPGGEFVVTLAAAGVQTVRAEWLIGNGAILAANEVELVCVAAEEPRAHLHFVQAGGLAAVLRTLGYTVHEISDASDVAEGEIIVARHYTRFLQRHVQQGGRLLLISDAATTKSTDSVPLPVGHIVPREGTSWQGDWATSFAWIRKQGPLARIPGNALLEMEWSNIIPESVIAGLPPWVQREHSWANLAVGWVHKTASLLTVMPYGKGQIAVTTFRLGGESLATDAMARALLSGIVELL
jgi:hypothetical protein